MLPQSNLHCIPGREADRSMQPASEAWPSEPEHDEPVGTVRQLGDRGIERHEGALVTNGKCQQVRIGDLPVAGQPLERHFGRPCQIEVVRPESMSGEIGDGPQHAAASPGDRASGSTFRFEETRMNPACVTGAVAHAAGARLENQPTAR